MATLDQLLHKLELSEYIAVFAEQQIDLATFMTMSEADLASIGITMFGPRRRLKLGTPLPLYPYHHQISRDLICGDVCL